MLPPAHRLGYYLLSAAPTSEPIAPEAPSTPAAVEIVDNGQAHQSWDFPAADAPVAPPPAPEPAAKTEVTPPSEAPATPPADEDIDDATFERIKQSARVQKLIDEKANGTVGAKLQSERAKIEAETRTRLIETQRQWDTALADYNKLHEDDDFYKAQVAAHGKAKVSKFIADVEAQQEIRNAQPTQPVFNEQAFQQEFNTGAVEEAKVIIKAALPFFNDLPEATRAAIDGLQYDPDGSVYGKDSNWLHHAFTQIGKGVEAHIAKLSKARATDLTSATEAGRNEALAAREAAAPLVVGGANDSLDNMNWDEINLLYSEGRLPGGGEAFRRYKAKFGIEW